MSSDKNHPRSSSAWKKLRVIILARDEYTCYYCGAEASHVDHVVSYKDEPSLFFDQSNLVSACRKCNLVKGSRSVASFLSAVSTPPVLKGDISPQTIGTVQPGPMQGQPRPSQP